MYVHDAFPSENDEQSAIHLVQDMVNIPTQGSFNLTKFTSDSKEVLNSSKQQTVQPKAQPRFERSTCTH